MKIKELHTYVKKTLPPKKYNHTLGVIKSAIILAKKHSVDVEKAEIASLLHDISKHMSLGEMKKYIKDKELIASYGYSKNILHGFAGSSYANAELHITDPDILNAIKFHSIGRKGMSPLEKIIYIADAIEENRNYPYIKEIREKVKISIDEGILLETKYKLNHLLEVGAIIHPNTIEMRNSILENL